MQSLWAVWAYSTKLFTEERQAPEAPGRQESINLKPQDSLQVHSVSNCTDKELEQELSRRRLDKEQR